MWTISNCRKVLQFSSHFDSFKWCAWDYLTTKISCDPELTELTRNHRTWCMLLRSKYCTKTRCCCIWLTCKTFQRDVCFKIYKGLLHMNDYYICVRRFVVIDPELPDSLYPKWILNLCEMNKWCHKLIIWVLLFLNYKIYIFKDSWKCNVAIFVIQLGPVLVICTTVLSAWCIHFL